MIKKLFSTIVLFVFIITSYGCVVTPAPRQAPPPPRKIRVKLRKPGPKYVWVKGHWEWRRGRYVWKNGYWKKRKRNRIWVSGHWRKGSSGWVWVPGHWR